MDQSQAQDILRTLRSELTDTRSTVEDAQRRESALVKLIEGYVELFPDLAESVTVVPQTAAVAVGGHGATSDDRPRGQEAVLRVLQEERFKGRYWTLAKMREELTRRSWLPEPRHVSPDDYDPSGAIRTSLDRLATPDGPVLKGRGERGSVLYFFQHPGMASPNFSQGPDDTPSGLTHLFGTNEEATTG